MTCAEVDLLLEALNIEDEKEFRIHVMEILGNLVLLIHLVRGMLLWLRWTKTIVFLKPEEDANYMRLSNQVDDHSKFIWEVVPPRAMMYQLRLWRRHRHLEPDFKKLLARDSMGRVPHIPGSGGKFTEEGAEAQEVFKKVLAERERQRAKE